MNQKLDWSTVFKSSGLLEGESGLLPEAARYKKALEALLTITDDFIYIKDSDHKFLFTSDAFARLTKHKNWHELVGKDDFDIFPKEHAEVYFKHEQKVIQNGIKLTNHEEPYYDLEGNLRWVTSTKNPVFDDDGNVIGLVGISKDITDLKNQKERISHLATHDDLTGLFNRRAFYELGQMMLDQAIREQKVLVLIYLDLDKFKNVNDQHGHLAGDFVLKSFSEHLKKASRSYDLVARIGGDEFAIALGAEKSISPAKTLVKRISKDLDASKLCGCTCSIGVASSARHTSLESILQAADEAMYEAKNNPEIAYCFAESEG